MNIRHDAVVHAATGNPYGGEFPVPVCGDATMPACLPEVTSDPVDCWTCKSITD